MLFPPLGYCECTAMHMGVQITLRETEIVIGQWGQKEGISSLGNGKNKSTDRQRCTGLPGMAHSFVSLGVLAEGRKVNVFQSLKGTKY